MVKIIWNLLIIFVFGLILFGGKYIPDYLNGVIAIYFFLAIIIAMLNVGYELGLRSKLKPEDNEMSISWIPWFLRRKK